MKVPARTQGSHPARPYAGADGDLAAQFGDGSLPSELAAAARRLVGFAFPGGDVAAFTAHLKAVAVWSGATTETSSPEAGDLWQGSGGRVAVVQRRGEGRTWVVIGPRSGGVIESFEVDGGTFRRAIDAGATN